MEHQYKMYSIVLRQLNGINNGVQTTHGVCEYVSKYWNTPELQKWIKQDKTLVVLNGGVYQNMIAIIDELKNNGIKFATFEEEDLNNLTTSICVLADERVWDREAYPSFDNWVNYTTDIKQIEHDYEEFVGGNENVVLKRLLNGMRTI